MVQDIDKKDVSLSKYKGKVLLIVNVASKWYDYGLLTLFVIEPYFLIKVIMFRGKLHPLPLSGMLKQCIAYTLSFSYGKDINIP